MKSKPNAFIKTVWFSENPNVFLGFKKSRYDEKRKEWMRFEVNRFSLVSSLLNNLGGITMLMYIDKATTNIELVDTLNQYISEYHQISEQHEAAVRAVNVQFKASRASGLYTERYLHDFLNNGLEKANSSYKVRAEELNAKVRNYVDNVKQKAFTALHKVEKSTDYQLRISNAVMFLRDEGTNITDETAAQILHGFTKDIETMQRFWNLVEHQKGESITDAYGNTTFPLTFGHLQKYEKFAAAFTELTDTAVKLFIRPTTETDIEFYNGTKLSVPMPCYMQLVSEKNAVEEAETIEEMMQDLFAESA